MIGGFRSDMSITRKTDGNFGNISARVLFSKVAYQQNGGNVVILLKRLNCLLSFICEISHTGPV